MPRGREGGEELVSDDLTGLLEGDLMGEVGCSEFVRAALSGHGGGVSLLSLALVGDVLGALLLVENILFRHHE